MKSGHCKNRTDIASQFLVIEWRVCLVDTSVQKLQKLQELGQAPESFPDKIIVASMVNDITN